MKKPLIISALLCLCTAFHVSAQGTLNLSNLQPGQEISLGGGAGPGSIPGSSAQLFLGSRGDVAAVPLTPIVSFFPDVGATQWLVPTDFTVPGAAPGTTVTLFLKVYMPAGSGYPPETVSNDFTSNLGGTLPSGVSLPAGDTATLQGFYVTVPEPSALVFGTIGSLMLLLLRRRR